MSADSTRQSLWGDLVGAPRPGLAVATRGTSGHDTGQLDSGPCSGMHHGNHVAAHASLANHAAAQAWLVAETPTQHVWDLKPDYRTAIFMDRAHRRPEERSP